MTSKPEEGKVPDRDAIVARLNHENPVANMRVIVDVAQDRVAAALEEEEHVLDPEFYGTATGFHLLMALRESGELKADFDNPAIIDALLDPGLAHIAVGRALEKQVLRDSAHHAREGVYHAS
jgi:hypothetical protein